MSEKNCIAIILTDIAIVMSHDFSGEFFYFISLKRI